MLNVEHYVFEKLSQTDNHVEYFAYMDLTKT